MGAAQATPTRMAATKAILVLLCVHIILCAALAQEQNLFIVSPSNNIAWLNSAAVFICRFNGETVTGIVNGIRVEDRDDVALIDYDFQRLQIGTYDLAMRVNASEANNNSEIWCQGRGPDVNSSRAQLIVQGTLAAPSNLLAEAINDTAISLKWPPPFTLNITNVDPDISNYTVHITNTATGLNETRTGIVDTGLIFSGLLEEDPTPCHNYSFTVIANNVVGEGEESEEVLQHFEGECPGKFTPPGEKVPWWIGMIGAVMMIGVFILCVIIYYCQKSKQVHHKVGEDGDDFDLNDLGNSNSSSGAGNGVLDSGSVVKGSDDANHDVSGPSSVIVAGGDMEADGVASSSNEEVRAHSRIQVDGDEAEVLTPGGPPMPPPQMQRKGVSDHHLRRRRLKDIEPLAEKEVHHMEGNGSSS